MSLNDLVSENSDLSQQQAVEEYSEQYTRSQGRLFRLNWFQKAVLIFVTAMCLVFTITYIVVLSKEGFLCKNTIFTLSEVNNEKIYFGKLDGKPDVFTVRGNTAVFTCGDETYGPYVFREDPSAIPEEHGWSELMTVSK